MTERSSSAFPSTLADLERAAEAAASPEAWDYLAHGAGDEHTMRANVTAWSRLALRPAVLRDMTAVSAATRLLSAEVPAPIVVAPTAMHRYVCDEAEAATARAAADVGAVYAVSMASTTSLEDIAAAAPGGVRWAQMYLLRDRGRTRALAERAATARYQAIVLSVDGAAVPRRSRVAGGMVVPPDTFRFPNLASPDDPDTSDLMGLAADFDPSVTPDDIAVVGGWCGLPVVVKGVMRGDDAARAVDAGASAIAVSNHGGRTLDGTAATADVLAEVVEAVDGRAEVYVDGGVRSGVDVLRALALGARAVLVGRPVLWGLAVGGAEGAAAVLAQLSDELVRAMALCGVADVGAVTPDLLLP